jgi:crotonobetainyl-CoA:carnitine CoA-transferase CaiB-like acyl-CoA transferase
MLGYPVSTVADIVTDPQIEARQFFEKVDGETYCGSFALIGGERPPLRYAAGTPLVDDQPQSRRAAGKP